MKDMPEKSAAGRKNEKLIKSKSPVINSFKFKWLFNTIDNLKIKKKNKPARMKKQLGFFSFGEWVNEYNPREKPVIIDALSSAK